MANYMKLDQRIARCEDMKALIRGLKPGAKRAKRCSPSDVFHRSREWRLKRAEALSLYPSACMCCGAPDRLQVDHIKPKSIYPDLALDVGNLQVLCWECNAAKWRARDETDYRPATRRACNRV